jgi:mono/diheme cytochrome c family protein
MKSVTAYWIRRRTPVLLWALILLLPAAAGAAAGTESDARGIELFETKIRPVLVKHCYECHSAESEEVKGSLRLDSAAALQQGGDSGPALVAGRPGQSLLVDALRYKSFEMPPAGKLSDQIIRDFEQWIEIGAPDPRSGDVVKGAPRRTIDLDAGRQFWSFRPVETPVIPTATDESWGANAIDAFVLRTLNRHALRPSPNADRRTLVRRLYFDLVGLPPTPSEVDTFANDRSQGAVDSLVELLLDSPQFGVHWGRHWLDVARYADSNGSDFNATFHNAWRYRDYVIKSLNRDKPFDTFVREQIAGDLLPYESDEQRAEQIIGTGFLMIGTKMLSERDKEKMRMDVVDEQMDSVGKAFMGLTLGCARCHDHKFDPIPTRDYYALAGIFRSTSTLAGESQKYVSTWPRRPLPAAPQHVADVAKFEERREAMRSKLKQAEKELKECQERVDNLAAVAGTEAESPAGSLAEANSAAAESKAAVDQLKVELTELEKQEPPPLPKAIAVNDHAEIGDCAIRVRGETRNLGPVVKRDFLQVALLDESLNIPAEQSGRRELADWIANPNHPLTARVIVNRIWSHLLGEGIVRSVDNFGMLGERPTHPELLDYLASDFIRHGWSTKYLIRQIVLSRTYQMRSDHREAAWQVDPENRWLWRAHRRHLPAEAIRDSMLLLSGQLDLTPSQSPVLGFGTLVNNNKPDAEKYESRETTKRSVYLPVIRNELPPILTVFDFADPDLVTGKRPVTNVPAQALLLMNSPFVMDAAQRISQALLESPASGDDLIVELYRRLVAREPTLQEIDRAVAFLGEEDPTAKEERLARLAHVLMVSTAFRILN